MQTEMTYISADKILKRLNSVRLLIVLIIAFGYASTMSLGPAARELGLLFGYDPSWIGIQLLFFFSGALAYRSLLNGRNGLAYLKSRFWRVFPLLLAITLTTILVIYPMLGKPMSGVADILALVKYAFLTLTCLDPGRVLPGLMDDAVYMCLIQGAIWTLRWGLLLHIAVVIASRFKGFTHPKFLLWAALISTAAYAFITFITIGFEVSYLRAQHTGLRLGYIFLIGMTVWAYRNRLPQHWFTRLAIGASLFGFAAFNYIFLRWTPLIEITLTLSLAYSAWLAATSVTSKLAFLENWPHLAIGLYLINWPTSQVLLHQFPDLDRWTLPAASLPLSLLLAILSHWALTGRINKFIQRNLTRKVPVQTARL